MSVEKDSPLHLHPLQPPFSMPLAVAVRMHPQTIKAARITVAAQVIAVWFTFS